MSTTQKTRRLSLVAVAVVAVLATTLIGTAEARVGAPYIRYGSTGEGVKCVQVAMNASNMGSLAVDGIFGSQTLSAVKRFQAWYGYSVDGIVGPTTGQSVYHWDLSTSQGYGDWCYNFVPTKR